MPDFFLDEFEEKEEVMRQLKVNKAKSDPAAAENGDQVSGVFQKIQTLISDELVKSVNGVFDFNLSGNKNSEWYLDLKNGAGIYNIEAFMYCSPFLEITQNISLYAGACPTQTTIPILKI